MFHGFLPVPVAEYGVPPPSTPGGPLMAVRRISMVMVACAAMVALEAVPGAAASSATLKLTPRVGPPTTVTKARGAGFQPGETGDLSFDGTLLAKATVKTNGAFAKSLTVPATAQPGSHRG